MWSGQPALTSISMLLVRRAAFAKMAPAFVISSKFTNSSYLRFPTFFTGIFITLPHSSHFLPIYEKKVTFR